MAQEFTGRVEIVSQGGNVGELRVLDGNGTPVFWFGALGAALSLGGKDNEGDIRIFDKNEQLRIHLDGESGDIVLHGADCAEYFELAATAVEPEPGTVMTVDPEGKLCPSHEAYDKRVVGVVSGAGDLHPGLVLGARPRRPVGALIAVTGTIYCKVNAGSGPIDAGDLLTTSDVRGHAMKAADADRSFGATLGKALRPLANGQGLIPVLVALR